LGETFLGECTIEEEPAVSKPEEDKQGKKRDGVMINWAFHIALTRGPEKGKGKRKTRKPVGPLQQTLGLPPHFRLSPRKTQEKGGASPIELVACLGTLGVSLNSPRYSMEDGAPAQPGRMFSSNIISDWAFVS